MSTVPFLPAISAAPAPSDSLRARWGWAVAASMLAFGHPLANAAAPAPDARAATIAPKAGTATRSAELQRRFDAALKLVEQKRTTEAIEQFRKLAEDFPQLPEPQNNLAVLYFERGDLDKASAALEAALGGRSSYDTIYRNLSNLNARRAAKAYAQALNIDTSKTAGVKMAMITALDLGDEPAVRVALNDAGPAPTTPPPSAAPAPAPKVATANAPSAAPAAAPPVAPPPAPAKPLPTPTPSPAPAPAPAPSPAPAPAPAPLPAKPAPVAAPTAAPVPPPASAPLKPPPTVLTASAANSGAPAASKPAPAASAVVAVPAPDAKPRTGSEGEAAVRKSLQAWAQAWESKNMESYVAAYAPGFKGAESSAAAWQAARRVRILGKRSIDVGLSNVSVKLGAAAAEASFTQSYTADQLKLVSRKTLHFELRDKRWVIVRESAA